jgi:hypothetical protein
MRGFVLSSQIQFFSCPHPSFLSAHSAGTLCPAFPWLLSIMALFPTPTLLLQEAILV